MDSNSHRMERMVIFAADKEGRIPFPKSKNDGIQRIRRALGRLKKMGLVRKDESLYSGSSPYLLTDLGRSRRESMISNTILNEVDSMNWNREETSPPSGLL